MLQQQRLHVLDQRRPKLVHLQRGRVERAVARHDDEWRHGAVDSGQIRIHPQPLLAAGCEVGLSRNHNDVHWPVVVAAKKREKTQL